MEVSTGSPRSGTYALDMSRLIALKRGTQIMSSIMIHVKTVDISF